MALAWGTDWFVCLADVRKCKSLELLEGRTPEAETLHVDLQKVEYCI